QVIMTEAAQEFVRPLTFAALSGNKVITGLWGDDTADPNLDSAIEHIAVAQDIDVLLVAPATADTLAKFAHGMANDFLTTLYLATKARVVLAPAMNVNMWEHPATRANIETLRARGNVIVEPGAGYLACGMVGAGRLAENERIVDAAFAAVRPRDLERETVLVTAGPTREPIDPVRFIGNRSSGKMGFAIAEAARDRGARVILVAGPTSVAEPSGVEVVHVERTQEMLDSVMARLPEASIVIKTAAVADYKTVVVHEQKLKRTNSSLTLELEKTGDVLAAIAAARSNQIVIGFAAETENVVDNARKKLESKHLDAIVVNDVSQPGIGFDSDQNAVTIVTRNGEQSVPCMAKRDVADRILDEVVRIKNSRAKGASH
ncbi:MAG TPA: bifunctional phosphopantothenoylcysteine decarboxylase/phosphopantothenate--cysteine ligase CoaBC, partial [Terriglobales bacterium]